MCVDRLGSYAANFIPFKLVQMNQIILLNIFDGPIRMKNRYHFYQPNDVCKTCNYLEKLYDSGVTI